MQASIGDKTPSCVNEVTHWSFLGLSTAKTRSHPSRSAMVSDTISQSVAKVILIPQMSRMATVPVAIPHHSATLAVLSNLRVTVWADPSFVRISACFTRVPQRAVTWTLPTAPRVIDPVPSEEGILISSPLTVAESSAGTAAVKHSSREHTSMTASTETDDFSSGVAQAANTKAREVRTIVRPHFPPSIDKTRLDLISAIGFCSYSMRFRLKIYLY